MTIFGQDSSQLVTVARLQSASSLLGQLAPALTASGVAGGFLIVALLFGRINLTAYGWLVSLAAALGALALLAPHWQDGLRREAERLQAVVSAEKTLIDAVGTIFPNATLFLSLSKRPFSNLPHAVLVTPTACIAVNILALNGTHQNNGTDWQQRDNAGLWRRSRHNPTVLIQTATAELCSRLSVNKRVVLPLLLWSGDGLILHDQAAVPIFLSAQPEPLQEWLQEAETMEPDEADVLVRQLEKVGKFRPKSPKLPLPA